MSNDTAEESTEPSYIEGEFYSLQEAFDNGYLTHENLVTVAYCYSENKGLIYDFHIPQDVIYSIKKLYADLNGVNVEYVCVANRGSYGNCYCVGIWYLSDSENHSNEIIVDGIGFNCNSDIVVWKKI